MTTQRLSRPRLRAIAVATAAFAVGALAIAPSALAQPSASGSTFSGTALSTAQGPQCSGTVCVHKFADYQDNIQTFTVPAGVHQLTAELVGGSGGLQTGGRGGAFRTVIPVTPGETLTVQNDGHEAGVSSVYRGTGAQARLLALAGEGGEGRHGTTIARGGFGGGWNENPGLHLVGGDGEGRGAGKGATPTAPGGVVSGALTTARPGQGPAGAPGSPGRGGTVDEFSYTRLFIVDGKLWQRRSTIQGSEGGDGYYGGGAGGFFDRPSQAVTHGWPANDGSDTSYSAPGGGGSGYLAPGLTILEPSTEARKAAKSSGWVTLTWNTDPLPEAPVVEEPVVEEPVVEEPVVEEPVVEEPVVEEPVVEEPVVEEPAVEEPAVEEPAVEEPADEEPVVEEPAEEDDLIEGGTLSGEADGTGTGAGTTSGTSGEGLLATTGAQVTGLSVLALALVGVGLMLRLAGTLSPGRTRHAR